MNCLKFQVLILFLLVFLVLIFLVLIVVLFYKSVFNLEVVCLLLLMVEVIFVWDGKLLLVDVVYKVFSQDFVEVCCNQIIGDFFKCLNMELVGYCSLMVKIVCKLLFKEEFVFYKDVMEQFDECWGDFVYWQVICCNVSSYMFYYLFVVFDYWIDDFGEVVCVILDQVIYLDIFVCIFWMGVVIIIICLLLVYLLVYLLVNLLMCKSNLLMILVLLLFWILILVCVVVWIVLL